MKHILTIIALFATVSLAVAQTKPVGGGGKSVPPVTKTPSAGDKPAGNPNSGGSGAGGGKKGGDPAYNVEIGKGGGGGKTPGTYTPKGENLEKPKDPVGPVSTGGGGGGAIGPKIKKTDP